MPLDNFYRSVNEAFNCLLMLKGRSLLALLGIITGCASVVALISTGKMAAADTEKNFGNIGLNTFIATLSWEEGQGFRNQDFSNVAGLSTSMMRVAPLATAGKRIDVNDESLFYTILGSNAELQHALALKLSAGRFISNFDENERNAVIGHTLAEKLKLNIEDSYIRIGSYFYKVVGIIQKIDNHNNFLSFEVNRSVIIHHHGMSGAGNDATINNLIGRSLSDNLVIQDAESIRTSLSAYPGLRLFDMNAPKSFIDSVRHQRANFTLLLLALGGVTLLGGGVGIMNMMVMNVSLRRREIGLRLALGARKKDILILFMLETSVLTVTGVVIGMLTGILASAIWSWQVDWQFEISISALILGGSSALITGLISGLLPAITAARLRPVEALREN